MNLFLFCIGCITLVSAETAVTTNGPSTNYTTWYTESSGYGVTDDTSGSESTVQTTGVTDDTSGSESTVQTTGVTDDVYNQTVTVYVIAGNQFNINCPGYKNGSANITRLGVVVTDNVQTASKADAGDWVCHQENGSKIVNTVRVSNPPIISVSDNSVFCGGEDVIHVHLFGPILPVFGHGNLTESFGQDPYELKEINGTNINCLLIHKSRVSIVLTEIVTVIYPPIDLVAVISPNQTTITCSAEAQPPCNAAFWRRYGEDYWQDGEIQIDSDTDMYECLVSNGVDPDGYALIKLSRHTSPTWILFLIPGLLSIVLIVYEIYIICK